MPTTAKGPPEVIDAPICISGTGAPPPAFAAFLFMLRFRSSSIAPQLPNKSIAKKHNAKNVL
jgi:hypothetical protein